MRFPFPVLSGRTAALLLLALGLGAPLAASAAQVDIKNTIQTARKYGPYVGVFGGVSSGQSAAVNYQDRDFNVEDRDGSAFFGIEIGYAWRTKYYVEVGLEFEGFYTNVEVRGESDRTSYDYLRPRSPDDFSLPRQRGDGEPLGTETGRFKTDVNAVAFMANLQLTLDLQRLEPWVLSPTLAKMMSAFRPYVGAGIGGAQLFFRNGSNDSFANINNPPVADGSTNIVANSSGLFDEDKFVFAYQIYAGLELKVAKSVFVYGEYRQVTFDKFDPVKNFQLDLVGAGLKIRY